MMPLVHSPRPNAADTRCRSATGKHGGLHNIQIREELAARSALPTAASMHQNQAIAPHKFGNCLFQSPLPNRNPERAPINSP